MFLNMCICVRFSCGIYENVCEPLGIKAGLNLSNVFRLPEARQRDCTFFLHTLSGLGGGPNFPFLPLENGEG
jgi:hypothetical protein